MTTVLPVLVLALLDSVNPSALVVTLTLLSRGSRLRAVLVYVAGIFATYLTLGVLLVLGLGSLIDALGGALESPAAGVVGAVIGGGMLLYAVLAPNPKDGGGAGRERAVEGARGLAGLFLLGAVITVLELPTALPYLGATGILAQSGLGFAAWFPVLLAYNAVFVLPPVVLAVAFLYLSERASARLVERLRRGARETTLWIYGLVGFYLLANGLSLAGVI